MKKTRIYLMHLPDRFWDKVSIDLATGCWLWRRPNSEGRGVFSIGPRRSAKSVLAHRVAYEARYGAVPDGLGLDHTCHNEDPLCPGGRTCRHRACVNPDHLEAVTTAENHHRRAARVTHCPKNHPYDEQNTYIYRGTRNCRACKREKERTRYWLNRVAAIIAVALVGAAFVAAAPAHAASTPKVISHRGYQGTGCTENTVCAFDAAAAHGADAIETDVRFTKTNLPVISHDATVDRTTNGTGKVSSFTQTQFTALKTNDGGHPATLWGALNSAKQHGITALVELKVNPTTTQWANFISKIPSGFKSQMTIQSFNSEAVWAARRHGFPMVRLLNTASTAYWTWRYDGEAAQYTTLTAGGIATLHAHSVPVYAWTVDDPTAWPKLASWGVDALITNANPTTVKGVL